MAIAAMSFPHLLAPLHALWAWAMQPRKQTKPRIAAPAAVPPRSTSRTTSRVAGFSSASQKPLQRPPLRVVRDGSGRMVISGRLADVCAELDRLAEREAERQRL